MFTVHKDGNFRDVIDGLSNTIAMGEIATDLGDRDKRTRPVQRTSNQRDLVRDNPSWCADNGDIDPARPQFLTPGLAQWGVNNGRGYRWADHFGEMTGIHTILPPNS